MQISVSKQIHADLAHQHGFLGEGIGIAYLDTGLFPHKDFSPHSTRIAKFVDLFIPNLSAMTIMDMGLILPASLLPLQHLVPIIWELLQNPISFL